MARNPISSLSSSNTFQTWFDRTNNIITEVNFLNSTGVTGITGGNGIGVTTDGDRNYTVRFNGNVSGSVTFSGPVNFLSTVSASSINVSSTKLSYSPKVSGLTAGNVVRIDSALGLTFAKADSSANAEVLGIVVDEDASYNYIAVSGQIDNSTFSNTVSNALGIVGATLGKGAAYFLSPTVAGGLTTIEPTAYGQVSKPILLGITGDKGLILPYRGIVLEGVTAGITAELDNKLIIEIDYSGLGTGWTQGSNSGRHTSTTNTIKLGDPVFYGNNYTSVNLTQVDEGPYDLLNILKSDVPTKLAGVDSQGEIAFWIPDWQSIKQNGTFEDTGATFLRLVGNEAVENKRILGLVSSIIGTPSSLGASKYILEITLPGGSFKVDDFTTDIDRTLYPVDITDYAGEVAPIGLSAGSYYWPPYSRTTYSCPYNVTPTYNYNWYWGYGFWRLVPEGNFKMDGYESLEKYRFLTITKTSATSGRITFNYENTRQFQSEFYGSELTAVPAFVGSLGGGTTGTSNVYNHLPNGSFTVWQRPFSGYSGSTAGAFDFDYLVPVADRWVFTNNVNLVGLTLTLQKQQFDSNQTEVPGSPYYYVDIKTEYSETGITANPEWKPRLENTQKDARLLQGQTATFSFYAKSNTAGTTLDLTFNRYEDGILSDAAFESAMLSRQTIVSGITLGTSWKKYSQSFVVPTMGTTLSPEQDGWVAFGFEFYNTSATISLAQASLQPGLGSDSIVTINKEQELQRCKPYYQTTYDLDETPGSTNARGNEETLLLGNLNGQIKYLIKFPVKMIETPAVVSVYSSSTGTATEAYNLNAGQDLKYTAGTIINYPWSVTSEFRTGGGLTGNVTIPESSKYGFNAQINGGAASFDTVKFHWIADADLLYRNV